MDNEADTEGRADIYKKEFQDLTGDTGNFESLWQESSERLIPSYSCTFNPFNTKTPGGKDTQKLFHGGPVVWLNQGVAVLEYLLTPSTQTWHYLKAPTAALKRNRNVRMYLEQLTRDLFDMRYDPNSGFSRQNQLVYKSLLAFGHGVLYIDGQLGRSGTVYRNIPIGSIRFTENFQGNINGAYRYETWTARQFAQVPEWNGSKGKVTLPKAILDAAKKSPNQRFALLHVCKENLYIDRSRVDYQSWPFSSCYIAYDQNVILEEGGYRSFPYAVARWAQSPGDIYPRGPGDEQLSSIKLLNEVAKTYIKATHKAVDPTMLAGPHSGAMAAFSARPGAINYGHVTPDGKPTLHAMPVGNLPQGDVLMQQLERIIRAAFLVDVFQILIADRPQQTATETLELKEEKGILLAPTVSGLQPTYLNTIIMRELDLGMRQRRLELPIRELWESGYDTVFESPMTRLQRAAEATGAERQIQAAIARATAAAKPEILDVYDFDKYERGTAEIRGYPEEWLKTEEDIAAERDERAQSAQMEAMNRAAPGAAALGKVAVMAGQGGPERALKR